MCFTSSDIAKMWAGKLAESEARAFEKALKRAKDMTPVQSLAYEGYEYPEPYCSVGFEEDSRDFADGSEGCLHRISTIKKRLEQLEEMQLHQYDGIGEFYERECKIEDAMKDAIIKACELADVVFASEGEGGLYKYPMTKEIPSALHDFAWRFRAELEDLGYEITEREQTTKQ